MTKRRKRSSAMNGPRVKENVEQRVLSLPVRLVKLLSYLILQRLSMNAKPIGDLAAVGLNVIRTQQALKWAWSACLRAF